MMVLRSTFGELCMLFFICIIMAVTVLEGNSDASSSGGSASVSTVIEVDSKNMHEILSHQPALLEFQAPWCNHCQTFARSYSKLAETLTDEYDFKVGTVDIVANPAISSRFEVRSIPAIYLYRDNKMWIYEGPIAIDSIVKFSTEGYLKEEALPYWSSPIGPMGAAKGILIRIGSNLVELFPYVSDQLGVPTWAAFIVVAVGAGAVILFIAGLGIYYSVVHAKND